MANILIITEGKKPEKKIIESIKQNMEYSPKKTYDYLWGYWGAGILDLYKTVTSFKFQDYLPILKEKEENIHLVDYCVDDFAQIFLLFDFDPQAQTHNGIYNFSGRLKDILKKCSDETSPLGKLLINYPMVESYLAFPYKKDCTGQECFFTKEDSSSYSSKVNLINMATSLHSYNTTIWKKIVFFQTYKICKFLKIDVNYDSIVEKSQLDIFENQELFFKQYNFYFSLSPIGVMLLSIYGRRYYDYIQDVVNLPCRCYCLDSL